MNKKKATTELEQEKTKYEIILVASTYVVAKDENGNNVWFVPEQQCEIGDVVYR